MIKRGFYLVRSNAMDSKDTVMTVHYLFFYKKPVIVKPWIPDVNFEKEDLRKILVWVQLRLPLNVR